jgi:hypothetical protein
MDYCAIRLGANDWSVLLFSLQFLAVGALLRENNREIFQGRLENLAIGRVLGRPNKECR